MRILVASPKTRGIGGVAQHVSKLIEKLRSRGHEVDVVSIENTPYINIKSLRSPSFALSSFLKALLKRARGEEYDVAHGHNIPSYPCIRALKANGRVLTLHGVYSRQIRMLHSSRVYRIARAAEEHAVRSVDVVTCISRETLEYYSSIAKKAFYIPNAIDFKDLPSSGRRLFDKQVVYAGRLSIEKGIDVLLKALDYIDSRIHVLVIGSGPLEEIVREKTKCRRNIHYIGYKPRRECLEYIMGSDALILPSRVEGMPTVVLEAMALKTLVIASRVPGVTDVVDDETAVLVEPENPKSLARAVNDVFETDYTSIISRAYERVLREFNWDVVIRRYETSYEASLQK